MLQQIALSLAEYSVPGTLHLLRLLYCVNVISVYCLVLSAQVEEDFQWHTKDGVPRINGGSWSLSLKEDLLVGFFGGWSSPMLLGQGKWSTNI